MNFRHIIPTLLCLISCITGASQEPVDSVKQPVVIPALFEYIEVPVEIITLRDRSEYLLRNFWNPFDFSQTSVGQLPLNHAFEVYVTPMRWASREVTQESIEKLIGKLKKNPSLLYQFTRAAEETLYGPNASIWIDEAYMPFIEALLKEKKIKELRKARYRDQLSALKNSIQGKALPKFEFITRTGEKCVFSPAGKYTIIEFGHPDCDECRMTKLRLDSDVLLEPFFNEGKAQVFFIVPDANTDPDWRTLTEDYPESWNVGAGESLEETIDIRTTPSLYLLSPDGSILLKNTSIDEIIYNLQILTQTTS